jgi:hypothetical protein
MKVDSVKYLPYNGQTRKTLYFNTSDVWIEGIGDAFGPVQVLMNTCNVDQVSELICFESNSIELIHDSRYPSCYFRSVGIEERIAGTGISIGTENKTVTICTTQDLLGAELRIVSLTGQLLHSSLIKESSLQIKLNVVGIYLVSITSGYENILSKKIVILD